MKILSRWTGRVIFDGADLREADLSGVDLRGADLREADLYGANLYGANLHGANLYGANLCVANLNGANLREAEGIYYFGPIGEELRTGYAIKHADCIMFQLGCFWGNTESAKAAIVEKYGENSVYEAQIDLADRILRERE